jgi:hypothetical protein
MTEPLYAPTLQELRGMSEADLIASHDAVAKGAVIGHEFYLSELVRRDVARQTSKLVKLTWCIALLTAVNVVVIVVQVVG